LTLFIKHQTCEVYISERERNTISQNTFIKTWFWFI